jgi:HlyD family secretion protein
MKKRPKWMIALSLGGLAVVAVVAIYISTRGKEEPSLHVTGIIDGIEVNLSSKVAGRISWICCNEGDMVKEGQTVVTLDSEDIKASVKQAMAGVERARADVRTAEDSIESLKAAILGAEADVKSAAADVEKARSQMEQSKKEAERRKGLSARNLISQESYDQMVVTYDVAVASYNSSKEKLNSNRSKREVAVTQLKTAVSQLESTRAALREAEANLAFYRSKQSDTDIKSPISGVVIFKTLEMGETLSPGVTILTVVDLHSLYARVDIDETKIGKVILDGPAFVTAEGVPGKVFKGRISEIGRYAEFATQRDVVRGREDIKTFRVKVMLDDPSGILKPGMTVDVGIPR